MAVPMSSAILVVGILLCIFFWIRPVAWLLGWVLDLGVQALNGVVCYISKLPGSVISQLTLTLPQLSVLYFIIICFYRYLVLRQSPWLLAALFGIASLQLSRFFS